MAGLPPEVARAAQLEQSGNLAGAAQLLRDLVRVRPEVYEGWMLLGTLAVRLGQSGEAKTCFEHSARLRPELPDPQANLGVACTHLGQIPEAIDAYRRALEINPANPEVLSNLGATLARAGRLEEGVRHLRESIRLRPDYYDAYGNLGAALSMLGRPEEAVETYRQAIAARPNSPELHNNLASALSRLGRLDEALRVVREALRLRPHYPEALNNLGLIHLKLQQPVQAEPPLVEALRARPGYAEARANLGVALSRLGRGPEAVGHLQEVIRLRPRMVEAHLSLGNAFYGMKQYQQAAECFLQALRLKPDSPEAHTNLGNVLLSMGRKEEAIANLERALQLRPDYPEAAIGLGNALGSVQRYEEAETHLRRAIELRPEQAEAHNNLANILTSLQRPEEAMAAYRKALELRPGFVEALCNLGGLTSDNGHPEEAIPLLREAIRLDPEHAESHNNLGAALWGAGEIQQACEAYQAAMRCDPEHADAHFNYSYHLLLAGDWEQGWKEYDWRLRSRKLFPRGFPEPIWKGEPAEGRDVVIHTEQGLGDAIQFIRYAKMVKQRGARVSFYHPPALAHLLESCPGIDRLLKYGEAPPPGCLHVPLLSLPRIFASHADSLPGSVPYLFADEALLTRWREEIARIPGFRVGIGWQGNPKYRDDRFRSFPLRHFRVLAELEGVQLVSLQKGFGSEQLAGWEGPPLIEMGSTLDEASGAFMDTAAVMKCLDLVITSDTAIAHLAGALGVPVWVALPAMPDWRWLLEGEQCVWYPTMRLFRQAERGDWDAVFSRMRDALQKEMAGRTTPLTSPDRHAPPNLTVGLPWTDRIDLAWRRKHHASDASPWEGVSAWAARHLPMEGAWLTELDLVRRELERVEADLAGCLEGDETEPQFLGYLRSRRQLLRRLWFLQNKVRGFAPVSVRATSAEVKT